MKSKYWPETIASFFIVGLGQILKGEGRKGLLLLLTFYLVLPSLVYLSLMLSAYLFLVTLGLSLLCGIILWAFNLWDALKHETIV
jgi:hypothetical protein